MQRGPGCRSGVAVAVVLLVPLNALRFPPVRLTPGIRLGPYEVLSILGAGGMAEVYRARDTRLGRDIALKVVNEALSGDPDLIRRFEQEARIAGSLNHPNLVAVYDFGLHEGAPYFVTELLQGESLRQRLSRGRLGLQVALEWSGQMAHGLAAAHARGVIHRDVKPENVFVGADGRVKLLDFGIAKLAEGAREPGPHGLLEDTVTPTSGATRTGSILGSPGYMSPEQVRGEALDPRTDLFSLGAVIYEMLSGRRAFAGATLVESGNAILHDDPEPLPPEVRPPVAEVVRRCLEKEPARRFQSASDLGFALDLLRSPTGSTTPPVATPVRRGRRARSILLALVAVTAVAAAFVAGRHRAWRAPTPIPEVEPITFRWGGLSGARFLPDGRVAYSGHYELHPPELFISGSPDPQALGLVNVRLLSASSTGELAVLLHPDWTRDGRGTLATVPSVGGEPRQLDEDITSADWSPRGDLAVVRMKGPTSTLEFPLHHPLFRTNGLIDSPRFSREGDRIAFFHYPIDGPGTGEILVTDLTGQVHPWSKGIRNPANLAWSADGSEIWFVHEGPAGWQPDLLSAVGRGGLIRDIYRSTSPFGLLDVAKDGRVLIANVIFRRDLVYVGDGKDPQTLLSWSDQNDLAALSAEGKVLFTVSQRVPNSEDNVWVFLRSKSGGPAQRLATGWATDLTPDGRWALVRSAVDSTTLSVVPTGVGQAHPIPTGGLRIGDARWMPDGKKILVVGRSPRDDHFGLYLLAGDDSPGVPIGKAMLREWPLRISHDGRWAAAMDEDLRTVIISLADGSIRKVPGMDAGAVMPRGWVPDGTLWISGAKFPVPLLRLDPDTGKVLETRTLRPDDPGSASLLWDVAVSPDGRQVAFTYQRYVLSLAILRGLER
jgi:eukaryotic-like serine/threonine-protein kinase